MTIPITLPSRADAMPTRTICPTCGDAFDPQCPTCNGTGRLWIQYRTWQREALSAWNTWRDNRKPGASRTFVAAVAGGAGKTCFGVAVAKACEKNGLKQVIVVCPSNVIVQHWLDAFDTIDLSRQVVRWNGESETARHIITTYQMMPGNAQTLQKLVTRQTLVILDECHHMGGNAVWSKAAQQAFLGAGLGLLLTGTPFREDDAQIPFVTYQDGKLVTNYEYDYGQALDAGYVRPIYIHAFDAETIYRRDDNTEQGASLYKAGVAQFELQQALNTALDPQTQWMRWLIQNAHSELERYQKTMPNAAGIIACINQDHARQVRRVVQKITHSNPVLAISDDPDSDSKIEAFRDSEADWLIVVKKGSEGLDIPRLRVGVYATNVTTELFFLQFAWRLSRSQNPDESASLFIPAHYKLIEYARSMRNMRLHVLNPLVETVSRGNGTPGNGAGMTPLSAEAGATVQVSIEAEAHERYLIHLLQIQEYANKAIEQLAINAWYGHDVKKSVVDDALSNIAGILSLTSISAASKLAVNATAQDYERQRQWKAFKGLFDTVQAMPQWCRDVLSLLHSSEKPLYESDIRKHEPAAPQSYFSRVRSKNPLIVHHLISFDGGKYRAKIDTYLSDICPAYDPQILVGYLLSGKLPETQS